MFGRGISALGFAACAFAILSTALPRPLQAQGKPKSHWAPPRKAPQKKPKKVTPEADKPALDTPGDDAAEGDNASGTDKPGAVRAGEPAGDKGEPSDVKTAGTGSVKGAPNAPANSAVKETKETKEGVKTYKFGTIEVEGRLKSPQIIYFLRRVRAEFDAGLLGHRSFLLELSDTRNQQALR